MIDRTRWPLLYLVVFALFLFACGDESAPSIGSGNNDSNANSANNTNNTNSSTNVTTGNVDEEPCSSGLTQCGSECVDTRNTSEYCGDCDTDCADQPGNGPCVSPVCVVGGCGFEQLDNGTTCVSDDGAGVCSDGACVQCSSDAQCTDPPTGNDSCWLGTCADGQCNYTVPDPDLPCGTSSCSNSAAAVPNVCGADGTCSTGGGPQQCSPYACDAAGEACLLACSGDNDCLDGFNCSEGTCVDESIVNLTISASMVDLDLVDYVAANSQWIPGTPLNGTITIAAGVDIGSSNVSTPALRVDTLSATSNITIVIEGRILGAGGSGGDVSGTNTSFTGLSPGKNGGTALLVATQPPSAMVRIDNQGTIGGGGGGGAAGYSKDDNDDIGTAGGGGAGYNIGPGGRATGTLDLPRDGQPGTATTGGSAGSYDTYAGGRGGDLGQAGSPATTSEVRSPNGGPGGPGLAVNGIGNFSWQSQGTVLGPTR